MQIKCLADMNPNNRVETFFKYVKLFYEKGCMVFESEDKYKIALDTPCSERVVKSMTLTPKAV